MNSSINRFEILLHIIDKKPQTIDEIENQLGTNGYHCPDDLARDLNVLRKKGQIKGAVSKETGRMEWWK
jgi:hypothetical protein